MGSKTYHKQPHKFCPSLFKILFRAKRCHLRLPKKCNFASDQPNSFQYTGAQALLEHVHKRNTQLFIPEVIYVSWHHAVSLHPVIILKVEQLCNWIPLPFCGVETLERCAIIAASQWMQTIDKWNEEFVCFFFFINAILGVCHSAELVQAFHGPSSIGDQTKNSDIPICDLPNSSLTSTCLEGLFGSIVLSSFGHNLWASKHFVSAILQMVYVNHRSYTFTIH